jgi:hypothetical protein
MKKYPGLAVVAFAIFLAASPVLWASNNYKVLDGPDRMYFGHISYVDIPPGGKAPSVVRAGTAGAEDAVVNLPIGPGDIIRTQDGSRCEVQFDTGTIIRLDLDTELKVETVLAQSLSTAQQVSNLSLAKGRVYVMYKEFDRREMFQILTPNAALKFKHNTVAMVTSAADGSTDLQVKYGKTSALYGAGEDGANRRDVGKEERLILVGRDQVQQETYIRSTDFELWNDDINARFDELHKGQSALPKALQRLPKAVFYFAQQFGNQYGEWLWDDLYGYVWRPFLNDNSYPWGGWQPYFYGQWAMAGGQMYWVPEEPWGWVPYHLGVWQWDKKHGWMWLPGSMFAPAWVDWEFFFGYAGWRPWTLYDWFGLYDSYYGPMGFQFGMNDGGWFYGAFPWSGGGAPANPPVKKITLGQLKQPSQSSKTAVGELKSVVTRVLTAYKNKDPRVLESVRHASSELRLVPKENLGAPKIQTAAVPFEKVPRFDIPAVSSRNGVLGQPADATREAARIFRIAGGHPSPAALPGPREAGLQAAGRAVAPGEGQALRRAAGMPGRADGVARSTGRPAHLDWNPDIRVARILGVHIEYNSGKNEIRCPELRLGSSDRVRATGYVPSLTTGGVSYAPASSVSGGSPSTSASPSSSSSNGTRTASGSAAKESSGSTGGGKIKN